MEVLENKPNYVVTSHKGIRYLTSYRTVVAKINGVYITLDPMWEYSRTTVKHVNRFLGTNAMETRKHIKSGMFTVENLNNLGKYE